MGNYYQGKCFSTSLDLHQEIASDCPTVSPDGVYLIQCTPSETKIVVSRTDTNTLITTASDYIPQQIACDPDQAMNDATDLAWLIVGVWVAAWTVRKVAQVIWR